MQGWLSVSTLAREFHVPEGRIHNSILSERLLAQDNKIKVSDFVRLYRKDTNQSSLSDVISRLASKDWVFAPKNVREICDAIDQNNNWGIEYNLADNLLISAKKKGLFFVDLEKEVDLLDAWLKRHTDILPIENYEKLWELLDEDSKYKLIHALGIEENQENISYQPQLHRVMSGIIQSQKTLSDWGIPEVHLFEKKYRDERSQSLLRKIIIEEGSSDAKKYYKQAKILRFHGNTYTDKRYTVNQYISLGVLLLQPEYVLNEGILGRIMGNSLMAQAVLFMAMHLVCGWRRGDILSIRLPDGMDITEIINCVRQGTLPLALSNKVWVGFQFKYANFYHASKNNGDLTFAASIEMGQIMGIYLAVCEYHRIRDTRESLFAKDASFDKLSIYQEAIGYRPYTEIFGNEIFRSRAMNKAFLTTYGQITSAKFKNMHYKSLPEILEAYLRGHKIDLNKGQKTIFHYIDFTSEGLSIDEISMALFEIGTFGFYKRMLLEELLPEISELNLKQTADVIVAADINVVETEDMLDMLIGVLDGVASMEAMPVNLKQLCGNKVINAIMLGTAGGKEENVFCLYQALHGKNNPECRTQVYCTNCTERNAYGSLCKYAIYSFEYVFNIVLRLSAYDIRRDNYAKEIIRLEKMGNVAGGKELLKLYLLEQRRTEQTEQVFEQFISDDEFPELLREDLKELYLERTNKNVLSPI